MTNEATPQPSSLAAVHYRRASAFRRACGELRVGTTDTNDSAQVTCVECRNAMLEQPMDRRGMVEYTVPALVLSEDVRQTLESKIRAERSTQARIARMLGELHELRDSSALRQKQYEDHLKLLG